jgi:hypothetical protein
MKWPGAITVQYMGKFHNFYLGWAREAKSAPFYPIYPPDIKDDPKDED